MTTTKSTTTITTTTTRRCVGSPRFGIEPHEATVSAFPKQPSQRDGLGRMCADHWRAYVKGLREARRAPEAEAVPEAPKPEPEVVGTPDEVAEPEAPAPRKTRRMRATTEPEAPAPRKTRRMRATTEPEQEVEAA